MNLTINKTATAAAKAGMARQRSIPAASPAFDGHTFERAYFAAGGPTDEYARELRTYELEDASPERLFWLARHHVQNAAVLASYLFERSPTINAHFTHEPKAWCIDVSGFAIAMADRIYPVCDALEQLGIDSEARYREWYGRSVSEFGKALSSVDQRTRHLKGKKLWDARWAEYKIVALDWYENDWLPVITQLADQIE